MCIDSVSAVWLGRYSTSLHLFIITLMFDVSFEHLSQEGGTCGMSHIGLVLLYTTAIPYTLQAIRSVSKEMM